MLRGRHAGRLVQLNLRRVVARHLAVRADARHVQLVLGGGVLAGSRLRSLLA